MSAGVALGLLLGACSSGGGSEGNTGTIPTEESGDVGTGGSIAVGLPFPITGIDLTGPLSADRSVLTINREIYDSLTSIDDETGEVEPELATSWEATGGGDNVWKFTIRDDVKFHDGTQLTSEDVKATIDALIAAGTPLAPIYSGVTSVEAPDPTTVLIHSSRPLGSLPRSVSLMGVGPAAHLADPDFNQHPIGSGPFEFTSFSGDLLTLQRNSDYWGEAPQLSELVFRQFPDTAARAAALQTGEIDVTWSLPPDLFTQITSDDSLKTQTVPAFLNYEILVNWDRPPLDKLPVRQALVHAIDADSIAENVLGGLGTPAKAPLSQTIFGSTELPPMAYDPGKAKQLLSDAGMSDLKLTMLLRPQDTENQVALAIISQWSKVGITVEPTIEDLATWTDDYTKLNFDLALVIRPTLTGDADYTLGRLYESEAKRVPCANPELDKLIQEGGSATDEADRKAAYKQALEYIWTNVCGVYPIDVEENYAWSTKLSGFVPSPSSIPSFGAVSVTDR